MLRVCFLLDRLTRRNWSVAESISLLGARGLDVAVCLSEQDLPRVDGGRLDVGLYVLQSKTEQAWRLAALVDSAGLPLLNRYTACLAARDPVLVPAVLATTGIPELRWRGAPEYDQAGAELAWARAGMRVFAIGQWLYATRRTLSGSLMERRGPVELSPELAEVTRRCGQAFGLELYRVHLARGDAGIYVLDIDPVPDFREVPDGGQRVAAYLAEAARGG